MKTSLLAGLMDLNLGRILETPLRFFTPTHGFWEKMEAYRDQVIVEFGAGRGDTLAEAKEKGFRWTGCDLADNSIETTMRGVHTISALRFPLAAGMVAIACRPDHSGWCGPALERALEQGCVAIYVGLEKNAERDLGDLYDHHDELIPDMGDEGEHMWVWTP